MLRPVLLLLTLLILPVSATSALAETLRVLSWPGYVAPDAVRAFELRHKVTVELVEVSSDEELWNRARAGAEAQFDVMAVNTAELQRYIPLKIVQPINIQRISNTRNQLPRFRKLNRIHGLVSDGNVWGIPFTYSSMGLIYNRKLVSSPPRSMSALWDKRHRQRIALYDSGSHNFSFTALSLGLRNPFMLDREQFRTTLNRLLSLRDNDPRFYATPEDLVALFRDHDIALAFGNYGDQQLSMLRKAGHDVGYVLPAEGALAWLDCWAILTRASNTALAHAWINHMLSSNVAVHLSEQHGLANTLRQGQSSMHDDDKLVWLEPVEDAASRARNWERFIAGARYSPRTQSGPTAAPAASAPAAPAPATSAPATP